MSSPAPVTPAERVEVMDVLRGVALFGVFLMNMAPFAGTPIMATEQQLLSLPSAAYDFALLDVLRWLVADKANTIFAFLFGLGFYLQMQRLQFRGADFEALYKRRLTVLLCIGCVHLFFVWTWDILHLYALAGFILLPLRRLSNRDLLAIGIILGLVGRTAQKTLAEFVPGFSWTGLPGGYADARHLVAAADLRERRLLRAGRQLLRVGGRRLSRERHDLRLARVRARPLPHRRLGRAARLDRARPGISAGMAARARLVSAIGLVAEAAAVMLSEASWVPDWEHREFFGECLHLFAVPVLATGYVAALVVAFEGGRGRRC